MTEHLDRLRCHDRHHTERIGESRVATSIQGVTTFEGEFAGTAPWVTVRVGTLPDGSELGHSVSFHFTGSTSRVCGSGTLTMADEWQIVDGVRSANDDDHERHRRFRGRVRAAGSRSLTRRILPAPQAAAPGTSRSHRPTAWSPWKRSARASTRTSLPNRPTSTGRSPTAPTRELTGDIDGVAPHTGTAWVLDNSTVGRGEFEFTGSIAGLGTGTMTYTDRWVFADDTTTYTSFITGGTGDFEGITGTGTFIDERRHRRL